MPGTGDSSKKIVWLYLIAAIVSLIGLGDAIYLTIQDIIGEGVRCTLISGCGEVLRSKYAHVGPVPLASVGACAYFVFFSLATLAAFGYGSVRPLLLILVSFMFLATLWLLYLQAFVIRHFCQYCLLSAAVTLILTILVAIASRTNRQTTIGRQ
jgi:uncharacterized membrane protein